MTQYRLQSQEIFLNLCERVVELGLILFAIFWRGDFCSLVDTYGGTVRRLASQIRRFYIASHGCWSISAADFLSSGSTASMPSKKFTNTGTSACGMSVGLWVIPTWPSIRERRVVGFSMGMRRRFPGGTSACLKEPLEGEGDFVGD